MRNSRSGRNLLAAALALAGVVTMQPAAALVWTNTVVDDAEDTAIGAFSDIVIDAGGRPHVAYLDTTNGVLKHAYQNNAGAWRVQTVDAVNAPGLGLSIAIDAADQLHLSYYTAGYGLPGGGEVESPGNLVYAKRVCWRFFSITFCSWQRETVAVGIHDSLAIQNTTSLALDPDGRANIAFIDNVRDRLRWARQNASGDWILGDVASNVYGTVSIAIDDAGFPQFAYRQSGAIRHARIMCYFIFCGLNHTTVDSGLPGDLRLAGGDQPRLVYRRAGDVRYASGACIGNTPCTWSSETLGLIGASLPRLRLDAVGNPHVAYGANSNGGFLGLYYAQRRFGFWQQELVSPDLVSGSSIGLVLDGAALPQISYSVFETGTALGHARGRSPFVWVPVIDYVLSPP